MTYWELNTFSYVDNPYFAITLCKLKKKVSIAQQGYFRSQSIEPLTSKCVVLLRHKIALQRHGEVRLHFSLTFLLQRASAPPLPSTDHGSLGFQPSLAFRLWKCWPETGDKLRK